jgi:hypothetical protein
MAIGNILRGIFNGAKEVGSHLPVVGNVIKQGEDTLGTIGNVGDNLFTTRDNSPSSYNQNAEQQQNQTGNEIGNLVGRPQAAAAGSGTNPSVAGEANAAKQAAAAEQSAAEIAMML